MTSSGLLLASARLLLAQRVADLEARVRAGDEGAWPEYLVALPVLAALSQAPAGQLLTTAEMAERLGLTPKVLLRRTARGEITPAVRAGRLLRWAGDERPVSASSRQRRGLRPSVLGRPVAAGVAIEGRNGRVDGSRRPA